MATTETQIRRLLRIYDAATPEEHEEGENWYPDNLALCRGWGYKHEFPVETCVGVLAATSQRNGYPTNLNWTARILEQGFADGGLGQVVEKCNRIIDGEHPDRVLSGKKVRAHYANLMGDEEQVCVDRHMFDIMAGRQTDDRTRKQLERSGQYEAHAAAVRMAARRRGVAPRTMQAVPWVCWRRLIKTRSGLVGRG